MDKIKFEEQSKARRKKLMGKNSLKVLEEMLKSDIEFFSTHYVRDRVTEIIEKTLAKLKYRSGEIYRQRKAFLDVLLEGIKLHTWKDEKKELMEQLKDSTKKKEAKEKLQRLNRLESKSPNTATEERDLKCESVCQKIASILLSKESFSDEDYLRGAVELDNELLITVNALRSLEELFEVLYHSIDESYIMANEKLWGKPRHKITMRQLDNILKNG